MRSIGEVLRYWESDEAARVSLDPRSSVSMPVHVLDGSRELSRFHYFRFVRGAVDDHAIAGWVSVMRGRQRLIQETAARVAQRKVAS